MEDIKIPQVPSGGFGGNDSAGRLSNPTPTRKRNNNNNPDTAVQNPEGHDGGRLSTPTLRGTKAAVQINTNDSDNEMFTHTSIKQTSRQTGSYADNSDNGLSNPTPTRRTRNQGENLESSADNGLSTPTIRRRTTTESYNGMDNHADDSAGRLSNPTPTRRTRGTSADVQVSRENQTNPISQNNSSNNSNDNRLSNPTPTRRR